MKQRNYHPWLIASCLVLAGVLAWAFRPRPVAVDLAEVTRGPLVVTVDDEGRTRIKDRYVVSAPLAGRLERIVLRPGDPVTAGHTVITTIEAVDPGLLDPRERALAAARVNAAAAARERSGPVVERARTAHDYAATELARARELYAQKGVSHRELDAAEQREAETAAELKSAEFARRIADYEFEIAQAALIGEGAGTGPPATGRRLEIRSPVSGRVLRVFQESSTVAAAGVRLVEIGDPADLEMVIEVLSTDAVKIAPAARVIVGHWGGEEPLPARVRVVEPAGFTKISALGVEEQRVNVIADFSGPVADRRAIGDGFRVEAQIVVWERDDVIKVPIGALFRDGESWAVFVAASGRARLRPVQLGARNSREAEVRSGLEPKEAVILHPGDTVAAGTRIVPR